MTNVAFVVPYAFSTTLRFLEAALDLPGLRVGVISADSLERLGPQVASRLDGHWRVSDPLDPLQLVRAARGLERQLGKVERLIGVLEQLQVPLASAREALELPGMRSAAARNFRDKARMKEVMRRAGIPCARHCLATSPRAALAFREQISGPLVIKPQAGAGAQGTYRVNSPQQLAEAVELFAPRPQRPMLLEEFVLGEEFTFDSVCVGGEIVWANIASYAPGPLEVMEQDWIQWTVFLPRDISGPAFDPIRAAGVKALGALGMTTGLSHMEWFRRADGSIAISEVAARPPGAQITSLMSYAYDADLYSAWARLVTTGDFARPQRRYAVGAAYLRGQGRGEHVAAVRGIERAQREVGELVVEVKLPRAGQPRASGYEGEGYVIVRHPESAVVKRALEKIIRLVRVDLA